TWEVASSSQSIPSRRARSNNGSSTSVMFWATSTSSPVSRSARCIRSAAWEVLECPRWVASYGVIPQTYSRAVPGVSGVTGATRPVRVSCRRSGRPEAGKGESEGEVQERTIRSYGPNRTSGAGQRVDHTTHQQAQQHQPGDDPVH